MSKDHTRSEIALSILNRIREAGFEAFFAGGSVRDKLLGQQPKDYDIATGARPEEIENIFPKTIAIGKSFGVIGVVEEGFATEVATFRREQGYQDGRRPNLVEYCSREEDARRRDFTINGMFYDPESNQTLDYVGGKRDLDAGLIRAIGDPLERFREDHLRMMRAVRFAHTLGFKIEPATQRAIQKLAPLTKKISAERIENELSRTLIEAPCPGDALETLLELNLLEEILPEMIAMVGTAQPAQFHPEGDVFEHTRLMLNLSKSTRPKEKIARLNRRELAYTLLLHDIGKPKTRSIGPGADGEPRIRFDRHASEGAEMAQRILRRLKLPRREIEQIVYAIRNHMRFKDVPQMKESTLRKLVGAETFAIELELHRLDCLGSHGKLDNYDLLLDFMQKLTNEPILPDPLISGHDLIEMGLSEGRALGELLKLAYQEQLDGKYTQKGEILSWVRSQIDKFQD